MTLIVLAIIIGYIAGFIIYNDYRQKTLYFNKQTEAILDRFCELGEKLKDLYSAIESSINRDAQQKEDIFARIESIRKDVKNLEELYTPTLLELKETMDTAKIQRMSMMIESLKEDMDSFKVRMQDIDLRLDMIDKEGIPGVDLGRISIGEKKHRRDR